MMSESSRVESSPELSLRNMIVPRAELGLIPICKSTRAARGQLDSEVLVSTVQKIVYVMSIIRNMCIVKFCIYHM